MRKEYQSLIFLFLFTFIIRIVFSFLIQVRYWDETVYLSLARDLSSNFFSYSLNGAFWSDFIPFGNFPYSWPNIGFRAPILPYTLALFYKLNLSFLIDYFIPFISSISCILIYFLGKKMFNSKTGLYAGILFSLIPINILWGFRISTGVYGVFFLLLAFIFFWKGFEEGDNLSKVLFGVFLALALLARYTTLWVVPVFLGYFLIRDRNLKILKDKYLWFSILAFFIVLLPWFIYGIKFYSNPLGAFIHGTLGASFWGGVQSPLFYLTSFWSIFSIIGVIFVFSLIYFFKKKLISDKRIYLLLIWFFIFLISASLVPHKEERFLLILIPPVCLLSGFFLSKLNIDSLAEKKKKSFLRFSLFFLIFLIVIPHWFVIIYKEENKGTLDCFSEGLDYIKNLEGNPLIYSDETPIIYAYTGKETRYYPSFWDFKNLSEEREIYVIYTDYDRPLYLEENVLFRETLAENLELVFSCDKDWGITELYRIS